MVAIEQQEMFILAIGKAGGEGVQLGYRSKEHLIEAMMCLAELLYVSDSVEEAAMTLKNVAESNGFKPVNKDLFM